MPDADPRHRAAPAPGFSVGGHRITWRAVAIGVLLVAYLLLTLSIIYQSPVVQLDHRLGILDLRKHYRDWTPVVRNYVILGQRGPATLVFLPVFLWIAWRTRSSRPLVELVVALILLNLSVGVVKLAVGRLGPRATLHAHDVFVGGDIYPSGHVSNAVVLYGLIAMIALRFRKTVAAAAVFLSVTVGAGTVFLDTHWFSDVVSGWIAGGLVLLVLPYVMPHVQPWADRGTAWLLARWRRRRARRTGSQPTAAPNPAVPAATTTPSADQQLPAAGRVTVPPAVPTTPSAPRRRSGISTGS